MGRESPHICVVGSSNIDLTFRTPRLPRPGETLAGQGFHFGFGGKGANQAVMASRLGAHVTMLTRVGRDGFGERIGKNFRDEGIDTTHVLMDDARSTGTAAIIVDDEARNCILVVPGANLGLSPADVRLVASAIEAADILLCQLEVPVETTREALQIARNHGVQTICNPAPAVALDDELLGLVDLCIPNETEIELLTGMPVNSLAQIEAAARTLLDRGVRQVIVTLGDRGALLQDQGGAMFIDPFPVSAIDPSGAGDAFIGGLAVFLAEGTPLQEALTKAAAVGALSVTRPGTQAAFPRREDVEAFLKTHDGGRRCR
jgi:ribokinase